MAIGECSGSSRCHRRTPRRSLVPLANPGLTGKRRAWLCAQTAYQSMSVCRRPGGGGRPSGGGTADRLSARFASPVAPRPRTCGMRMRGASSSVHEGRVSHWCSRSGSVGAPSASEWAADASSENPCEAGGTVPRRVASYPSADCDHVQRNWSRYSVKQSLQSQMLPLVVQPSRRSSGYRSEHAAS